MTKVCVICGKEFETNKYNKKCCSPECTKENTRQLSKIYHKEYREKNKKEKVEVECVICGKKFIPKAVNGICCSSECRKIRERQRNQMRSNQDVPKKEKPKKRKKVTISKILRELEKYNKKNRTNLSYGQYVMLLSRTYNLL